MKNVSKLIAGIAFAIISSSAAAIPFNITGATFAPGTGYGQESNEAANVATLLDVRFSTQNFVQRNEELNAIGDSFDFFVGTVNLAEANNNPGITSGETDNLDVSALLTIMSPTQGQQTIRANGAAVLGRLNDMGDSTAIDYSLLWTPLSVNFGTTGLFDIAFKPLSFTGRGSLDQFATITLRSLSVEPPTSNVPEPATAALLGLGLLGFAASRRKSAKSKNA